MGGTQHNGVCIELPLFLQQEPHPVDEALFSDHIIVKIGNLHRFFACHELAEKDVGKRPVDGSIDADRLLGVIDNTVNKFLIIFSKPEA